MKVPKVFKSVHIRSKLANRNILLLFVNKILAAFVALQLVPTTVNYVDATQYGIWVALSSLVSWMVYFDFGLTHGFRNAFAMAKAKGDMILAKEYLSTSYAVLIIMFFSLMTLGLIANMFIDWSAVLGVDKSLGQVLSQVFIVSIVFFSIQMICNLFTTLLLADQQPGLSATIVTIGQLSVLLVVYGLTFFTKGNLLNLSFAIMGIPALTLIIFTIIFFRTKYRSFAPTVSSIRWPLSKDVIGLGGKFFVIQVSMLLIFQFANLIILRVLGAEAVTTYTIVYRYLSIIYIATGIVFLPFWSAFTDAYAKGELAWMRSTYTRLSKVWALSILIFLILLTFSSVVYENWLAKGLQIDFGLTVALGINMIILSRANLYMTCLNGTGKVHIQMIVYLIFSIVAIPLMYVFTNLWAYYGVVLVTSLVYFCQAIAGHLQLKKVLDGTDNGIWSK